MNKQAVIDDLIALCTKHGCIIVADEDEPRCLIVDESNYMWDGNGEAPTVEVIPFTMVNDERLINDLA